MRVEDVRDPAASAPAGPRCSRPSAARGVRADYRCTAATAAERYEWEQEIAGTPFERILQVVDDVELKLGRPTTAPRSRSRRSEELRGLSRLGSTMLRGAARRRLDEALDGIENALVGLPD